MTNNRHDESAELFDRVHEFRRRLAHLKDRDRQRVLAGIGRAEQELRATVCGSPTAPAARPSAKAAERSRVTPAVPVTIVGSSGNPILDAIAAQKWAN